MKELFTQVIESIRKVVKTILMEAYSIYKSWRP